MTSAAPDGAWTAVSSLARLPGDVVALTAADGSAVWVSPSVERTLGYTPEAYLAAATLELVHPDDQDTARSLWEAALRGDRAERRAEMRLRAADGTWRWVEALVWDGTADPEVGGIVSNFRDITDRKEAEAALVASEARFRALLSASSEVVVVADADGVVTMVSEAATRVFGRRPDDLVGTTRWDFVHPEDADQLVEALSGVFVRGGEADAELRVRHADGSWRWVEVVARNLLGDPAVEGVVCTVRDIDERVRQERRRRAVAARFTALVAESTDVVLLTDPQGIVHWASPALEHVLGHRPGDLVGTNGSDLIHPEDLDGLAEDLSPTFTTPGARATIEVRVRRADGGWAWIEETITNLLDDERVGSVVVHLRDITDRRLVEDAMRASEERFRAIAQSSPIGIFQQDAEDGCVYVNERWQEITGLSAEEAAGDGWISCFVTEDLARLDVDADGPLLEEPWEAELRVRRPDGQLRWVSVRSVPLHDETGRVRANVGTLEDVTERLDALRESARLTDIFEATHDLVGIADRDDRILYLNRAARRFVGLSPDGPLGETTFDELFPDEVLEAMIASVSPGIDADGVWTGEMELTGADGAPLPMSVQVIVHTGDDGEIEFYSAVMRDISERKRFESQLAHQATHDPLTGLPNRNLLLDRLTNAMARADRKRSRVAVLFLDLDHFKVVNDSLGHALGDELLVAIARRLEVALRPGDTVARFGGDEFVVLCEDLVSQSDAVAIAERVDQAITGAFEIDDNEVYVGVSIGIAFPDDHDVDPATLIRDADAAMYRAKEKGRARWEVFDNAMRASAVDRLDIESALRRALDRRELRVHYQPIIDLASGRIAAVEALLRWEHPDRGLLAPGEFITVAEETGLIVPIGAWVLEQACRQVHRWHASVPGLSRLGLSVNLSGRQLGHPTLVEEVADIVADTHMEPSRLELEITESVLMDDVDRSEEALGGLRRLGVRLGVDDFGTGYSSMSYLRRFPVDVLKVDRSFVDGLGSDPSDSAIVAAIITLAHTLGLSAVAEGVESPDHVAELRNLGCDRAQGYLFARPAPGDELAELLRSDPSW